jgi:hypothetical protein
MKQYNTVQKLKYHYSAAPAEDAEQSAYFMVWYVYSILKTIKFFLLLLKWETNLNAIFL